jgi:serine phosphatase RsbU (regulator of sigma subunit)
VRSIEAGGAALGVFPEWAYENASVALKPGDRLLLVTDGITEASNAAEQEFGEEKLAEAALRNGQRSAAEMSRLLIEDASSFCASRFHDDATLLVIAAK